MSAVDSPGKVATASRASGDDAGQNSPTHLGPDAPATRAIAWIPDPVFIVGMLLALVVVAAVTLKSQPAGLSTPAWWPIPGIALGLGIRFRRRYTLILALTVAAVTVPVFLWAGRPLPLALSLAAAAAVEMIIATLLLRGRQDRSPRLSTPGDLANFLGIAFASAIICSLLAAGAFASFGDFAAARESLETVALKHVAGMALLTPLFMAPPLRKQPAGYVESVMHMVCSLTVAAVVFLLNDTVLPLAFLTFLPLVGAALRISTPLLSLLIVGVATIATGGAANGVGPFAFDELGGATGTVILQVYQVSTVVLFLTLSLVVGSERDMSLRLFESEELFRKSFNSSVAGKLMVIRTRTQWIVERANPSAKDQLPGLREGIRHLEALMGEDAVHRLSLVTRSLVDGNARLNMKLADGRCFDMSVAVLSETSDGILFALHFHDVTEAERLRELEKEERDRAAEVQRALLPTTLPAIPGWTFGTFTIPARQVGGDFYDVRVDDSSIVLSLGDVMGKGMDAGMLAAATRTALRSHDADTSPSDVVNHAAGILDGDLRRISAFVTLAYVLVDMDSGEFRFTDAGHGLHFVVRTGSGRVERLVSDDMPLGLGDGWRELCDSLDPGDMILLVSDGVLDRWGGALDGLEEAIARCISHDGVSPQAMVNCLCADAPELLDGDDITAVALCRTG